MMLFIWCFVSTLAPYPMNSFFVSFFYLSAVLKFKLMQKAKRIQSHNTQGGEVYEKPKK
jgi:hypothetical protein